MNRLCNDSRNTHFEHDDSVFVVVVMLWCVRFAGRPVLVGQQRMVAAQRRVRALPAAVLAPALRQPERHALVTGAPLRTVYLRDAQNGKKPSVRRANFRFYFSPFFYVYVNSTRYEIHYFGILFHLTDDSFQISF